MATLAAGQPRIVDAGDIHIRITFTPPDNPLGSPELLQPFEAYF
jgi:hypothetical protein